MPRHSGAQWGLLLALSIAFVAALEALRLPAGLFVGAMAAAVLVSAAGGTIRVPARPFVAAQAVVGCLIARSIPLSIAGELLRDWPLFLTGILSVVVASAALGWLLTRWQVLPGSCAIWGSSPGGATAMVVLADAYGADIRLVAVMQYSRMICVAAMTSVVSRLWVGGSAGGIAAFEWFPPVAWGPFAGTLAVAGLGAFAARRLRLPGGPLLLPLAAGVILQDGGWLRIELPSSLLAASYALIGWNVGLRFTRPILSHAARALPHILASILVLMALCAGFAALLVAMAGVDPLTAYLATSPGGADAVAIIAASTTKVDAPFVMAMQTARLLVVLATGPGIARFVARRMAIVETIG